MGRVPLLLVHAAACCFLAGLVWVVQVVVYPGFLEVGDTPGWARVHAAHSARMTRVVMLPWAVQGLTLAALLVTRPAPLSLLSLASISGLATVVLTATLSVPLHGRLSSYDETVVRRLVATNWCRTAAWTVAAVCSLVMVAVS